jgi:hypothetical protein
VTEAALGDRPGPEPRSFPPAFAFAVPAVVGVATMLMLGPTIFAEGMRDWAAYRDAGQRLAAGAPIYVSSAGVYLFDYPPATAAIWSIGLTPATWLLAKIVALVALAAVIGWPLGIPAVVLLLMTPSLEHDLVLGNFTTFYCLALSWSALRPGRTGSIALGLLLAIAMKPVIGPYLLWLLLVRRSDLGWVVLTAGVASAIVSIMIGPGIYIDYIVTLPRATSLASAWPGNIGLASISPLLGTVGVAASYVVAIVAARRHSLPLVIGALMFAQPSYGVAYGLLLVPAVVIIYRERQALGITLAAALPALLWLTYAPVAGLVTLLAGMAAPAGTRRPPHRPRLAHVAPTSDGGSARELDCHPDPN